MPVRTRSEAFFDCSGMYCHKIRSEVGRNELRRMFPVTHVRNSRLPVFAPAGASLSLLAPKKVSKETRPTRQNRVDCFGSSVRRFGVIGYGHALMRRPAPGFRRDMLIVQCCASHPGLRTRPLMPYRRLARMGAPSSSWGRWLRRCRTARHTGESRYPFFSQVKINLDSGFHRDDRFVFFFCFSSCAKRVFDFSPSDKPTTEGSAELSVMEAGLTARSAAKGRGTTPKPFVTVHGCTVTKAPAGME